MQAGRVAVPFDLDALDGVPDWRRGLAWPIAVPALAAPMRAGTRALLRAALDLDDPGERDAALLILPAFANRARAVVMAAATLDADAGLELAGGPPELDTLRGGEVALGAVNDLALPGDGAVPPRWRAFARAASWTPAARLPRALARPGAVAVTHNPLLAAAARREPRAVGFVHAARLMAAARVLTAPPRAEAGPTADTLAEALVAPFELACVTRARAVALVAALARRALDHARRDLDGLARLTLPRTLWTGTGGNHAARAIGLAVAARGGTVTRFAHGGSLGPIAMAEQTATTELAVTDTFVVPSEGARALLDTPVARDLVAPRAIAFAVAPAPRPPAPLPSRPRPARPTVMYVATASLGFTVHAPPFLPDVLYLDWQLRLAEALGRLPIRLVAKPHPEGLWRGRRHPLADVAETVAAPFESVMAEADAFVFDYPCSTTFWTALATDRPVVYLDLGLIPFAPAVAPELARRCSVLRVDYGADNRPLVPREALADALARCRAGDPATWRALQGGAET